MANIKVHVKEIGEIEVESGKALKDISKQVYKEEYKKYLGAKINNEIFNLNTIAKDNDKIEFFDIKDKDGYRIYAKTISAIFIMACKKLYPERTVQVEHFLGEGLYVEFEGDHSIDFKEINTIETKMNEIIDADYDIYREKIKKEDAIELFRENNYVDKIRLLNTW